jgi:aminomethyltransferase
MPEVLLRTPLYERHRELGARLVPFAGWEMPVQYAGVIDEVRAVRERAGLFDVSHMGEVAVRGAGAHAFLQAQVSNDLDRVAAYEAQYTLLTNDAGGIVDDLIAYRLPGDDYLLVVNASNAREDLALLQDRAPADAAVIDRSDANALLALQGPRSLQLLAHLIEPAGAEEAISDPESMPTFTWGRARLAGADCRVARTGYTGEPGVEIFCDPGDAVAVWDVLLAAGAEPCGLAARDTLRTEACYPLHGNDISADTNAVEAGLGWVCAPDKAYPGSQVLRATRERGPARKLAAFRMTEKAVPRPGLDVLDAAAERCGRVTSGTFSPTLDAGIGMAYLPAALAAPGTPILVDVRGRVRSAVVAAKPLYRKES